MADESNVSDPSQADPNQPVGTLPTPTPQDDPAALNPVLTPQQGQKLMALLAQKMTNSATTPLPPVPQLTLGQRMAAALIAGGDPGYYQSVVAPALHDAATAPFRQYQLAREADQQDIANIHSLLSLNETMNQNRETMRMRQAVEQQNFMLRSSADLRANLEAMERMRKDREQDESNRAQFQSMISDLPNIGQRAEQLNAALQATGDPALISHSREIASSVKGLQDTRESLNKLYGEGNKAGHPISNADMSRLIASGNKVQGILDKGQEAFDSYQRQQLTFGQQNKRDAEKQALKMATVSDKVQHDIISDIIAAEQAKGALGILNSYGSGTSDLGGPVEGQPFVQSIEQGLGSAGVGNFAQRAADTATLNNKIAAVVAARVHPIMGSQQSPTEMKLYNDLLALSTSTYTKKVAVLTQASAFAESELAAIMQMHKIDPDQVEQLRGVISAQLGNPLLSTEEITRNAHDMVNAASGRPANAPKPVPSLTGGSLAPAGIPPGSTKLPFKMNGNDVYVDPNGNKFMVTD